MMKKRRYLLLIILMMFFVVVSCDNGEKPPIDDTDDEPPVVTISEIRFEDGAESFTFDLDEFKLKDLNLEIVYSDNSKQLIPIERSMISDYQFEMLLLTGEVFLDVNYLDKTYQTTLILTSNKTQAAFPKVAIYCLEEIVEGQKVYTFYSTGSGSAVSMELEFDLSGVKTDVVVEKFLDGVFVKNINNNKLNIIYSFGTEIFGSNKLFTITANDDFVVDYKVENSHIYKLENKEVLKEEDVRYYKR